MTPSLEALILSSIENEASTYLQSEKTPLLYLAIGLLLILTLFTPTPGLTEEPSEEQKIKAALIYKLPKFVKWPEEISLFKTFNICLTGTNTLNDSLSVLTLRRISGKPITITYPTHHELKNTHCQLLFISHSETDQLDKIISNIGNQHVLTVSDMPSFAENGGGIEIHKKGKRLAFRINNAATKRAGLELSAPLLDMATVIKR